MEQIYLKEPTMEEKEEIIKMCIEFKEANDKYPFEGISILKKVLEESYEKFLDEIKINKHIDEINPEYANQTTYILIDEKGYIYGATNIRHELKGKLYEVGGNIGYAIRPSERKKKYGNLLLSLALKICQEKGLTKVLISCRKENIASSRVIENNGRVYENDYYDQDNETTYKRYWININ